MRDHLGYKKQGYEKHCGEWSFEKNMFKFWIISTFLKVKLSTILPLFCGSGVLCIRLYNRNIVGVGEDRLSAKGYNIMDGPTSGDQVEFKNPHDSCTISFKNTKYFVSYALHTSHDPK